MAQDYLRSPNKALVAKIQSVEGVFETMDPATDAIPMDDFDWPLNPETLASTEATGAIFEAETDIVNTKPSITGTCKMRGSGSVTTPPRFSPLLIASGHDENVKTVIPATGVSDVTAGGASQVTIDLTTETDWPNTDGAMVGRLAELSGNPATAKEVSIIGYDVTGTNVVVTFDHVFSPVLDNTTKIKAPAGVLYTPAQDVPDLISIAAYLDGRVRKIRDVRGTVGITIPGANRGTLNFDLRGNLEDDDDEAVPVTIDFSGLPSPAIWRKGRATLDKLLTGCSNFTLNQNNDQTQYPNPNVDTGFDANIITKIKPGGELTLNMALKATHDRVGKLTANTKMAWSALLDKDAGAGGRWLVTVPNLKFTDVGKGDRQGIAEHRLPYQAVYVPPVVPYALFMC